MGSARSTHGFSKAASRRSNETGHHDGVGCVDRRRRSRDVRPDFNDLRTVDQDVGILEFANRRVERYNASPFQQQPATRRSLLKCAGSGHGEACSRKKIATGRLFLHGLILWQRIIRQEESPDTIFGPMELLSVNVGEEQPIRGGKPSGKTGIYKMPVTRPVQITTLGLRGDAIVDTVNHGGPDQAVYVFTRPDYDWWSAHIGRTLEPGTFGENLTLSSLESAALNIGERLQVGGVLLEVTSPRVPCVTIAARMQDPQFVRKFKEAERPGVYCRVLKTGSVQAGDLVDLIPYSGTKVSILETFRAFFKKSFTVEELQRFLSVPLHYRHREYCEGLLREMER
jgi:MOSC domain-containing protein YiiM